MARKISKTMADKLTAALADPNHEMIGAATNTNRAMIERGLVRHQQLRTRVLDKRGHLVRSHGLVLTEAGLTEARRLGGLEAPVIEVQPVMYDRASGGDGTSEYRRVPTAPYWVRKEVEGAQAAGHRVTVGYYGEIKIEGEGQTVRFWPQTEEEQTPTPAAPAAQETPAPATAAEPKPAPAVKRGDLVVVEMNVPYTVGTDRMRTERETAYDVMVVTGLFRDGRIKMVRSLAWGDDSAPMKLEGMLYATGERKIVPAATITDMPGVTAAVRAHTYPNSTTPRRFPSLDAVRDALRPFHAPAAPAETARISRAALAGLETIAANPGRVEAGTRYAATMIHLPRAVEVELRNAALIRKSFNAAEGTVDPNSSATLRIYSYPWEITNAGRTHLTQPQAAPAPQPLPKGAPEGTAERAAKMTPEDVADAVEDAMQWLPYSHRDDARAQPASVTLAAEFKRAGSVMRRALKHNGPGACMSAIKQYERVTAALVAARRFEAATAPVSA
ncbi:hypothetical protein ACWGQT_07380 [Streptomyces yangpuensis]